MLPCQKCVRFSVLYILPVCNIVSVLDLNHSKRYIVVSHCCVHCLSLMTYNAEHLFLGLCAICISSSVRYLLRSWAHFFNHIVHLYCWDKDFCMFWINSSLADVSFSTFSPSLWIVLFSWHCLLQSITVLILEII